MELSNSSGRNKRALVDSSSSSIEPIVGDSSSTSRKMARLGGVHRRSSMMWKYRRYRPNWN
eukprot:scaffold22567_cov39-Cylindrotheca_fusiformis.AAC.1